MMRKTKPVSHGRRCPFLYALLLVCLGGAIYLSCMAAMERVERRAGESFYNHLASSLEPDIIGCTNGDITGAPSEVISHKTPVAAERVTHAESSTSHTASIESTPESISESVFAINFDEIHKACPDVVGWLHLEGSAIDYPIVHGLDNDFYLHHLPDGTANRAGSIMLDAANSADFRNEVSILHGHHMASGKMFGSLDNYRQEEYYETHKAMHLDTPDGNFDVLVFAAFTVNGHTFSYPTSFENEAAFERFVNQAQSATPYVTGVTLQYGDRILLLSTCAYDYTGARFLVMGKIVLP